MGASLKGKLLVGGTTKGSTAGPGALLELMYQGCGPAGFLSFDPEPVLLAAAKAMSALDLWPSPVAIVPVSHRQEVLRWCKDYAGERLILDADSKIASIERPEGSR